MPKKLKLDGKFAHAQSGFLVMYVVQDKQRELEIDLRPRNLNSARRN